MLFTIDAHNGLAIFDQIVRQVTFAVASDVLEPGQLVPSVREMARDLAVNPNTVARAYRTLQEQGVLSQVRGTGLEVNSDAPARCRKQRIKLLRERLRNVLAEAIGSGMDPAEVRQLIDEQVAKLS